MKGSFGNQPDSTTGFPPATHIVGIMRVPRSVARDLMSDNLTSLIAVAAGRQPADLVLANGRVVNVISNEILETDIAIKGDRIAGLGTYSGTATLDLQGAYVCPGFIDAHVHVESSLLSLPEYARAVAVCGTTAIVADPHEFANVVGIDGIRYLLDLREVTPIDVFLTLSSCVPASHLEASGIALEAADLEPFINRPGVLGIAEMMNYPGVISGETGVLNKIRMAGDRVIDGHAPGVTGREACAYRAAGIMSDHECVTSQEAIEKLRLGFFIMIREGSQTRNLKSLLPAVTPVTADRFMFCTDDKDVRDLLKEGHIDHMIRTAISAGLDPILAIRLATLSASRYFGLKDHGAIVPGAVANVTILDNLKDCRVLKVFHRGRLTAENGVTTDARINRDAPQVLKSTVKIKPLTRDDIRIPFKAPPASGPPRINIIHVLENRIDTQGLVETAAVYNGELISDPPRDLAKLMVIERHQATGKIGRGFVRGFGLRSGAMASSVAHDAHNIIVVGVDDSDMLVAANRLIEIQGGLVTVEIGTVTAEVPLPLAGLVSDQPAEVVAAQLDALMKAARRLGCCLEQPFMALSFLSLSVIGRLKLTHLGLIDVERFAAIDLVAH
jgi:adenine deaminase